MRYFFDTTDRKGVHRDEMGVDCQSHEAARKLANKALGEMFRDMRGGDEETFTIAVRAHDGQAIFDGKLVFIPRWRTSLS